MSGERMPTPPKRYAACRTHDGDQRLVPLGAQRQITHLVALDEQGSNGGRPTVCGLTRFDGRDEDGRTVTRSADLAGWSMGGGVWGEGVDQVRCPGCWSDAEWNCKAPADWMAGRCSEDRPHARFGCGWVKP